MLVKFFRHGSGSGAGPLNYLLGSDRQRADAKVLYGDPMMTEQLINATPFKQKYKSGVLSFTEKANQFTDKQKMDIMQRFEKTLFAGLEPDQYDILWIEHSDKDKKYEVDKDGKKIQGSETGGRLELNFVIPCQELRSGKSLQPFFAGADLVRVNAFKNIINHEYKLTNPDDPIRKRNINPYINNAPRPSPFDYQNKDENEQEDEKDDEIIKNPQSHQLLKEAIDRKMLRLLDEGRINERPSVSYQLTRLGLTIERETKSSISVSHPNIKKNIRLKGFVYNIDFDGARAQVEVKEVYQDYFEQTANRQYQNDLKTWQIGVDIKEAYHQELYGNIKAPEPFNLKIKAAGSKDEYQDTGSNLTISNTKRPHRSRP